MSEKYLTSVVRTTRRLTRDTEQKRRGWVVTGAWALLGLFAMAVASARTDEPMSTYLLLAMMICGTIFCVAGYAVMEADNILDHSREIERQLERESVR